MISNKFDRKKLLEDYVHPVLLKTGKSTIFQVEKREYVPYIERILPLAYKDLYEQLKELDIAIPRITEIVEEEDQLTVIEEYISSPNLAEYMKEHDLTSDEIHLIMIQLLEILKVLHHLNPPIIHRDIKPENIFYDGHQVILSDFNVARFCHDNDDHDTTVLGTIGYAAPEQFGLAASTPATDLYACGILLNYLYMRMFPSVKMYQGAEKRIIKKATSIAPEDRYQEAQAFIDDLNGISHDSYALPGFRTHNKIHMIIASFGYLVILLIVLSVDGKYSLEERLCRSLTAFFIMMTTISFLFNYRHLDRFCLFHAHRHKAIRLIGIFLTYLIVILIIFFLFAVISGVCS